MRTKHCRLREPIRQQGGNHQTEKRQNENPFWRKVAIAIVSSTCCPRAGQCTDESTNHRLREARQCVNRGDCDGTGADESYLCSPDRRSVGRECHTRCSGLHRSEHRHRDGPGNHKAEQHRHANRQSDQMARAEQRQRESNVVAARGQRAHAKESRNLSSSDTRRSHDCQTRGRHGTQNHGDQSFAGFTSFIFRFTASARSNF